MKYLLVRNTRSTSRKTNYISLSCSEGDRRAPFLPLFQRYVISFYYDKEMCNSLKTNFFQNLKNKTILFKYTQQCHSADTKITDCHAPLTDNEVTMHRLLRSPSYTPKHLWKGYEFPKLYFTYILLSQVKILKQNNKYHNASPQVYVANMGTEKSMYLKVIFKIVTRF